ncbi:MULTISPECIES: oligosaccharide flippase family protein [Lysobacter]|uniref:oligosaccharide flippase family protein n=1 Tax=Lysobacter TaxID=68 RepID=UPI001F2F8209|nr:MULTISPECIES: oligosaccharide flippase family protein [Lysobacter]UJB19772.1 oligosaccharide flippase family protein [Lysobacter capsici]UJQ26502.1 oligosaccharide flippase family protein [Lysobacter gummosus]
MIRRLITTASLSAVSAMASRGAIFAGVLLVAGLLGPRAFGQFTLIQTTALLFTTFCALSLGQMATKIVAEALQGSRERMAVAWSVSYGSALLISLVFAVAIVALSPLVARYVGHDAALTPVYASSSLLVLAGFLTAIQNGVALAVGRVKEQAWANLLSAPIAFAIMVLAAFQRDLHWAMYGYIASQIVIAVGQERSLRRYRREHGLKLSLRATTRADWSVLWRLGLPSSLAGLLTVPAMWLVMVMLSHTADGATDLGHFALGNQARSILLFGIGVVANAALPMLSSALAQGDRHGASTVLRHSMALLLAITGAIALLAALAAPPLIHALAPAYAGSVEPLQWLLASVVATAPTTILMRKATADGRPSILLYGNAMFCVVLLATAAVALHMHGGATGLAFAYFLASLLQLLTFALFNRNELRWKALARSNS